MFSDTCNLVNTVGETLFNKKWLLQSMFLTDRLITQKTSPEPVPAAAWRQNCWKISFYIFYFTYFKYCNLTMVSCILRSYILISAGTLRKLQHIRLYIYQKYPKTWCKMMLFMSNKMTRNVVMPVDRNKTRVYVICLRLFKYKSAQHYVTYVIIYLKPAVFSVLLL